MAQIVLSGEELVGIVQANGWIPEEVSVVEVNGREIGLKVRTPLPLFKSVKLSVQFVDYQDGRIILQLATNRLMDSMGPVIDKMLGSLHLEDHGARWEYPRLYLAINPLVRQRVRGLEIKSVAFQDGCFHIATTCSAVDTATDASSTHPTHRPAIS